MRRILCVFHMCHLQETSVCDACVCVCVCLYVIGGEKMTVTVMILMMTLIAFTEEQKKRPLPCAHLASIN